jgi:hypothetical protein
MAEGDIKYAFISESVTVIQARKVPWKLSVFIEHNLFISGFFAVKQI